jgi:hypothetical protein
MPLTASLMCADASAAVYVALMVSFLVRKASTSVWSRWGVWVSFVLLLENRRVLGVEVL